MGMSWTEIGLIILVGIVLFGRDNRLPEMARSLGKAIGEFRRGMDPSTPSDLERRETESSYERGEVESPTDSSGADREEAGEPSSEPSNS